MSGSGLLWVAKLWFELKHCEPLQRMSNIVRGVAYLYNCWLYSLWIILSIDYDVDIVGEPRWLECDDDL